METVPDFTGKKICVIGGGNVSMDATRTALRLGAESVTCVYRRRVEDMTALAEEIEEAMAEGCQILPLQAPVRIEADEEGKVARPVDPASNHQPLWSGWSPRARQGPGEGVPHSLRLCNRGHRSGHCSQAL